MVLYKKYHVINDDIDLRGFMRKMLLVICFICMGQVLAGEGVYPPSRTKQHPLLKELKCKDGGLRRGYVYKLPNSYDQEELIYFFGKSDRNDIVEVRRKKGEDEVIIRTCEVISGKYINKEELVKNLKLSDSNLCQVGEVELTLFINRPYTAEEFNYFKFYPINIKNFDEILPSNCEDFQNYKGDRFISLADLELQMRSSSDEGTVIHQEFNTDSSLGILE